MNPASSPVSRSHPRLACRITRTWCAVFGRAGSRHVSACPDCREFFRAADALETALRHDATHLSRAAAAESNGLERRILQAVRDSEPATPAPIGSGVRSWRGAMTLGMAAAVVAIMVVYPNRRSETEHPVTPSDAKFIVETVQTLSSELMESVIPTAGAMVANNPLQHELDSVYGDMRSALNFLAVNFLPTARPPAAPNSTI